MDLNKLWKILQEMGISDHFTCLLRNLLQVKKQQLELVAPTAAYTQSHSRPGRMLSYCIPVAPKALTRTARCTQLPPFSGTEGIAPPRDATG